MAKEVFNRHELKFLINQQTYYDINKALKPYLTMDLHGDGNGYYTVSNIYYDTKDNLFHYEKMKGQDFRQKLRLRTYNQADLNSDAFIEIKKKHSGLVNKRRTILPLSKAYEFIGDNVENIDTNENSTANLQILKEIKFLVDFYELEPKVVLCYDRQAFQSIEDPDLRVTFDKNLRKRTEDFCLASGSYGEIYLPQDIYVLEIKVSERIPLWLAKILSEFRCSMQSFSKYSTCHNTVDTLTINRKTG